MKFRSFWAIVRKAASASRTILAKRPANWRWARSSMATSTSRATRTGSAFRWPPGSGFAWTWSPSDTCGRGPIRCWRFTIARASDWQLNDDLALTDVEILHDFEPFDSGLTFDPPAAGDYFVRLVEQSGAAGPRAVYRLTAFLPEADFALHQWPDAVPIWGPGSTAAFVVTVDRLAVVGTQDIELTIEGLPEGWQGSTSWSLGTRPGVANNYGRRVFLTITAPADAPIGSIAPFRVVGRVQVSGQTIERIAQPITTYIPTDRTYSRWSYQSRAIVAAPQGPYLETPVTTLTVGEGSNTEVPIRLVGDNVDGKWPLVANLARNSFQCVLGVPQPLEVRAGQTTFPLKTDQLPPGVHSVVICRAWASEVRKGMPGPCTPIISVTVTPK